MIRQILLLCFFVIPCFFLHPDTLELSNGDTISGKIVSMDEEVIIIVTGYGRLEVKRSHITRGVFSGDGKDNPESGDGGNISSENVDNDTWGVQPGIPEEGLVCEFLFDNTYKDSVGTVSSIKNTGNIRFCKGIDGIEHHAVSTDGTGGHLLLSGHRDLDGLDSFTISCWVNVSDWEKTQYILSKWSSTEGEKAEGKFALYTKQGFILCYIVDITGTYHNVYTEKPVKPGQWNHIVVTCHQGKAEIHVNNICSGEKNFGSIGLKKDTSPLYILTAKASTGKSFAYYNLAGMLDNLRIYNRALSGDELAALYREKQGE